MLTLSVWSKVVRLCRSFIASLSSASLRSSIRRSVVSSRLQGGDDTSEDQKEVEQGSQRQQPRTGNAPGSRSEWFDWFLFASASRWKVQHLYGCTEKRRMWQHQHKELCVDACVSTHMVLSLCVCQSAVIVAPSVCCCAALCASTLPPAGYTAAAGGRSNDRKILYC